MPLPMIHLAVAARLGTHQAQCLSPAFLLGSLSPDAIHMRPQTNRDDKRVTHLINEPGGFPNYDDIHALAESRAMAKSHLHIFSMGYAAHILTDSLWRRTALEKFRSQIPANLDQAAYRTLYYGETDQIDFNLYRHAGWRPDVWQKLAEADAPGFPPLLTSNEIDQWRDRTLRWFSDPKNEPGNEPTYITDTIAHDFIDSASAYVAEQFDAWGLQEYLT